MKKLENSTLKYNHLLTHFGGFLHYMCNDDIIELKTKGGNMIANILGQDYEIQFRNGKECPKLELLEAHGIAELYDKKLIIDVEMNSGTGKEFDNFKEFENKVVRHEIMHAFFHEAGLRGYCEDEALVDWLALQIPKISKVMQEHNLL